MYTEKWVVASVKKKNQKYNKTFNLFDRQKRPNKNLPITTTKTSRKILSSDFFSYFKFDTKK